MQDNNLLEGIISDYYNSVKDSFFYRQKNLWKSNTATLFFVLAVLFFMVNIIPLFPAAIENYLSWIIERFIKYFNLDFLKPTFWIRWLGGTILSSLILGILFFPFKFWTTKEKKRFIKTSNLNFCNAFTLRQEIKSFLINENESHLDKISGYFEKVHSHLVLTSFYGENRDSAQRIPIYKLREKLQKNYNWIEFSKESNDLIDSFETIDTKIKRRINQKAELEILGPCIDLFVLYEFSFVKPNLENSQKIELKEQRLNYLREIQKELNKLKLFEEINDSKTTKKSKIKSVFDFVSNLFTNSNILIMFLSWLVLLTLIFITTTVIILSKVDMQMDSTIFMGLLSAPFLGAITLTATIYSRNKKQLTTS